MFKKKESLVSQLNEEVGRSGIAPIDPVGLFRGFSCFYADEEKSADRKMFADLLESFFDQYIADNYDECTDCGCLILESKVEYIIDGLGKIPYCKHCKPAYDEIVREYDEEKEESVIVGYLKNGVECTEEGKIVKSK